MANNSYDLIITDLEMEGGTRADMIGMIRWRHNIGDLLIPIVVFSTNTTRRLIQGAGCWSQRFSRETGFRSGAALVNFGDHRGAS